MKKLFIHIPKCGGNTIKQNIDIYTDIPSHSHCDYILSTMSRDQFKKRNPFTIIRNPFDRLVSWYTYHTHDVYATMSFEDWVNSGAETHWDINSKHYNSPPDKKYSLPSNVWNQRGWLTYNGDILEEINIYKFEEIFKRMKLPVINASDHPPYKEFYTSKETIRNAQLICNVDIESFQYEF